jgi:glycosyltransferase involved in cell wall biosynthesis
MRVCMLAPELLPNRGGVGSYCVGLIRELSRKVDLTVLTPQWHLGRETFTAKQIEAYFDGRIRAETISEAHDSFLYNPRFQWAVLRRTRQLLRAERFDAVHAHHAHMPDVLARPMHPGTRTIRTVHSTIGGQLGAIRQAQRLGGASATVDRWQLLLELALRSAERSLLSRHEDYFLGVSRWGQQQLEQLGVPSGRIGLASCGVDPHLFAPGGADGGATGENGHRPTVLFGGRPTMIRGASVLAEAIPQIVRRVPEVEFLITGSREADNPVLAALPPSLRGHVRYTGHLPYDELPSVYRRADVAIAPTYYDNLPIRVLEALAMGLPVVASSVGGIPEVVIPGRTGVLIPPGNPDALADSVVGLLRDPATARRLGEQGRELVRAGFTWELAAEATHRAYDHAWSPAGLN